LYVTFTDSSGTCPCLDGLTFTLERIITNTSLIAWRLKPECSPWYPIVLNCETTYVCSGITTYAYPATGPQIALLNNTYGENECIFQLDWTASIVRYGIQPCNMSGQAIKNPYPFVDNYPNAARGYDSTATFPCSLPINVTFSKLYFDASYIQFSTLPCFGCYITEGQHPITVTITE
jgi:hypothetical protein